MTKDGKITVYGIFDDELRVEGAITRLRSSGFRASDIAVLFGDDSTPKEFGYRKKSKLAEGTSLGGTLGAILGSVIGWLAGTGHLSVSSFAPFIAAGPLLATLSALGIGTMVGAIIGGLIGVGIPEYEAKRFEGMVKKGKALLSVHCDTKAWATQAEDILVAAKGEGISRASEAKADVPVDAHGHPVRLAS